MSRWGKISWLLCGLSLAIMLAARIVLGGWMNFLWFPFGIFVLSFVGAIVSDYKVYIEFLSMRTTKHGMNMGVMILLAVTLLVAINIVSVLRNKTWDFTEERLNSLAPQSEKVVNGIASDFRFKVFYRGAQDRELKNKLKAALAVYTESNSNIRVDVVDAYVENLEASKYLKGLNDADKVVLFAEFGDKKVRVAFPFTEQNITSAMIKATRKEQKKIYFLTGHGEREITSSENEGLKALKDSLESSAYVIDTFNMIESDIPKDASVVAIIGPKQQIFETEFTKLRDFVRNGGALFIALDPGYPHKGAHLVKTLGAEFKNNYVINDRVRLEGKGAESAIGMIYSNTSEITKSFRTGQEFTIFDLASEIGRAPDLSSNLTYFDLVQTPPVSFSVNELQSNVKVGKRRSINLAVAIKGKFFAQEEKSENTKSQGEPKETQVVIFGDSDFIATKNFFNGLNRDLAMNSFSFLTEETDLISIRPKQPKGTKLTMTSTTTGVVVIAGSMIPMILLGLSFFFWYRRRNS